MFLASGHSPSLASSKFSSTLYIIINLRRLPSPCMVSRFVHQARPCVRPLQPRDPYVDFTILLKISWNLILISCLHVSHKMVQSNKLDTSIHKIHEVYASISKASWLQIHLQFRLGITRINQATVINNCNVWLSRDPAQHPMLSIESRSTSSTFPCHQSRSNRWVLHPCRSKSSIADVWV